MHTIRTLYVYIKHVQIFLGPKYQNGEKYTKWPYKYFQWP
jgi:hypothetical protein